MRFASSLLLAVVGLGLIGCARTAAIPLAADTIQITTSAAPVCGAIGAQGVALRQAAVETIRRGFDRFQIVGGGYQNNVHVVGHTPIVTQSSGTLVPAGSVAVYHGRTFTYGGAPIIAGSHDQGLIVKMFRSDDAAGANAVDARTTLGPKWKEVVASQTFTCL